MNAIFGMLRRDGSPVEPRVFETLCRAMPGWMSDDSGNILLDGSLAMGRIFPADDSKTRCKRKPDVDDSMGIVFTAAGRIDNRDELIKEFGWVGANHETSERCDSEIFLQAYLKWRENSPVRIRGDWAFAAFDRKERRLFLARDHYGVTSLYYYVDPRVFVFASSRAALLSLDLVPREMDELYLAQVLVTWPAYHGERTIRKPIKRLPPAHFLVVTAERIDVSRYWRLEDTPELRLSDRSEYAETFKCLFDQAVRCRLRSADDIAVTLSGGLDSGSVASTAAHYLQAAGKRLTALTSAPLFDTKKYVGGNRFGDELPFARATAQHAGNIDLHPVTASSISPIQAIRHFLTIRDEPAHSAGNLFWMQDLLSSARKHGCRTLLTGQMGNGGISWGGDLFSQSIVFQLRSLGWRRWSKEAAKRYLPLALLNMYRNARTSRDGRWRSSAINPNFADRLDLLDRLLSAPDSLMASKPRNPLEQRCLMIRPGSSFTGATWAEIGAYYGLEVRDPTADVSVLAFTLSVPDHVFMDPKSGLDRWLIRESMKGRLPDEVRLNRQRGRQAGDLVPRLRACAEEVEDVLDELAAGSAREYLNLPYMRQVWSMVRTDDTRQAYNKSVTVLTRGIMAGLWVNGFYNAS